MMKFWTVKSDRSGVEKPIEREKPIKITKGLISNRYDLNGSYVVNYTKYVFNDQFPYEVEIDDGEISHIEDGYGTGIGDLWEWTYYTTTSKEDADSYYKDEILRVVNKYHNKKTINEKIEETTIDKKIKQLLKLCDTFLFVEHYSHTNGEMYKISNPFTHYNKDIIVLGFVHNGIEESLDLAIGVITEKKKEFYGEDTFNKIENL